MEVYLFYADAVTISESGNLGIITARTQMMGKVLFSQVCVCPQGVPQSQVLS